MQRPLAAATTPRRTPGQCTAKFFAKPRGASTLEDYHFDDPNNNNIFKTKRIPCVGRGIDKSISTLTELSEMDFLWGKYVQEMNYANFPSHNATNLDDISNLISSVAAILRLWDDKGTAQDEHQNGADGSYIQCYMNDQPVVSYEQAREHVSHMIEREWKRLNKECFNMNNHSTRPFQEAALNLARMVPLMYSYDDNQRLPVLAEYMNLMLLSPASLEPDRQNKISSFEFSL
ncbi:hypothetical protein SASPL_152107 [Salvia splendens]|uniref:Terpene synthase metal-binding domain-containing protein n=1 Tax=Salvia splendens TaxID=180675 RepID=A0A8X8Z0Z6_SALSN|nr:hypothetical protein SASPL_152107 [Salvia splendens]